jgi:hypothetical protein
MSLAAVNYCSASLTQYKQQKQPTTQNKKADMSKSKKKNIKVRDLNPKKDAKGGFAVQTSKQQQGQSLTGSPLQRTALTGSSIQGTGKNVN